MKKLELVQSLVDELAKNNNTIDLDVYARGLSDMHDKIIEDKSELLIKIDSLINKELAIYELCYDSEEPLLENISFGKIQAYKEVRKLIKSK
jgi:hypothetical protein